MTSSIAWLDTSRSEQKQMREIINLFALSESRDELGIGQVRDAFSDLLFPGTSTLHTRARYLLFIPWCFEVASARRGADLEARSGDVERQLILALRELPEAEGVIGKRAGVQLKTLPSSLYWGALTTYGILRDDRAQGSLGDEAEELVSRRQGRWHATLPPPPLGFPQTADSLRLDQSEASFLQERILSGAPGTYLAHLMQHPAQDSAAPWADPAAASVTDGVRRTLAHAELFSLVLHGAALTYNLELARAYTKAGLNKIQSPIDHYREQLDEWQERREPLADRLAAWDLGDLFDLVRESNPQIGLATTAFLTRWVDVCRRLPRTPADDPEALELVRHRERSVKREQSRLTNEKLLGQWSGAAGAGALTFRWGNVRRIVGDIHEGLGRAAA